MRVLLFCFTVAFAIDYQKEFNEIHIALLKQMEFYSPWQLSTNEKKIEWYFCPQGEPGFGGIMGYKGDVIEKGEIDLKQFTLYNQITDYQCDVQASVEYILKLLENERPYRKDMLQGSPGPVGHKGRNTKEHLEHLIRTKCYKRQTNSTLPCLMTMDVYYKIKRELEILPIGCPSSLVGPIGKRGPLGKPGIEHLDEKQFEDHLDSICPHLIE